MGIAPIWGFQLATAIPLAFLLRLNKALVVLAANISIPPMIPVIIFLSHVTGKLWMGKEARHLSYTSALTPEVIGQNFFQYFVGAFTLAAVAGLFFGLATWLFFKLRREGDNPES